MAQMLVIADDLTGAADCGVACAGHGLTTMVVLGASEDAETDVHSVDADTRVMAPEQAASETARIIRVHAGNSETIVYKKVDSTMRGNIAVELAAALETRRALAGAGERIVAVLAPAFPANGRTTVNGLQLIRGRLLEETGLWQYERMPPRSNIAETLGEAHLRPALLALDTVRCGGSTLRTAMCTLAQDADVLVCDAETDEDLRAIADASLALGRGTIWAGSAGLAYPLPRAAGLEPGTAAPLNGPLAAGPTLFVVGSGSSVAREQVKVLDSWTDALAIRIAPAVLLAGDQSPEWRAHHASLERALNAGRDVVVLPAPEPQLESGKGPLLSSALAELVRPFAETVGALVATGGETARAVFLAWGIHRLRLMGEVEPGLPYSITAGWRRQLPVLTKAGAFGRPETLLHCRHFLRELDRRSAAHPIPCKGLQ